MSGVIQGLSVSDVVNISIVLQPNAAPTTNFGIALAIGYSDVIDITQRYRIYTNLAGVAADFGTTAAEYNAAAAFFDQAPQPALFYIGRWARSATSGILHGGVMQPAQEVTLLTQLQGITAGTMTISVDGTPHALTALNFSSILNLNGAATVLGTALTSATVTYDGVYNRFNIESKTTGASSLVSYGAATTGVDVSAPLLLTAATGASVPVPGILAETPLAALALFQQFTYYGVGFAVVAQNDVSDAQHEANAAFMEASNRIYGVTCTATATIDPTQTSDLASALSNAGWSRTFTQYSSSNVNAVFSFIGRAFTVDYTQQNSTITMKFKTEPGITPEILTETQAAALQSKNCNAFVKYANGVSIIQEGVMCSGLYFDTRVGADWQANDLQTALFNALYLSPTKIPQTDSGMHILLTTAEASMDRGVNNGLCAPGIWNESLQFGTLSTGDTLSKGYYVYMPPVASQDQSDRSARKAPPMQIAYKLAGAVHSASGTININN
jgi:Protein of unknown function (DUF3383)